MNAPTIRNSRARCGKIARLPLALREQLNRHLLDNQPGPAILAWLNSLPETRQILQAAFNAAAITKQNLSEWRHGGYQEWLIQQEVRAQIAALVQIKIAQAQSNQNLVSQA